MVTFLSLQESFLLPFYTYIHFPTSPTLYLTPGQLLICSPILWFSHLKNYINGWAFDLSRVFFFPTQSIFWRFTQVIGYIVFSPSFCWVVFHEILCTTICLINNHPLTDTWVVFNFCLLWIKFVWHFCTGFIVNTDFRFSGKSVQWTISGSYGSWMYKEIAQLFLRVVVSFYISTINVWVIRFTISLLVFGFVPIFYFTHFDRYVLISHCSFNLLMMFNICFVFVLMIFNIRFYILIYLPTFCLDYLCFYYWILGVLYIFHSLFFVRYEVCKHFPRMSFIFLTGSFTEQTF